MCTQYALGLKLPCVPTSKQCVTHPYLHRCGYIPVGKGMLHILVKWVPHWDIYRFNNLASFNIPTRDSICKWTVSSEFGTYRLCEQQKFRQACASAQSRQNLRCSLIQAASHEEPSDRKPDLWPLWMAEHAQLKFVMTECSKTQIRLTGLKYQCLSLRPQGGGA